MTTPAEVAAALAASKMQDRIALSFAGNEPDRIDEDDEWWTTPRSIAEQAMEAALAEPLWRVAEEARRYQVAAQACRNASASAIEDQGVAESFKVGYAPLDAALVEFVAAEHALRKALAALDANVEETP